MAIFKKQLLCCKGNPGQTIKFQLLFPLEMSSVGVDFWLMFQNESIIWGLLNDRYRLRNLGMSDIYRACNLNISFKLNFKLHYKLLYFFNFFTAGRFAYYFCFLMSTKNCSLCKFCLNKTRLRQ